MQLGSLHAVSPTGTEKGVQPRAADHHSEDPPCSGRARPASGRMGFATQHLRSLKKATSRTTAFWNVAQAPWATEKRRPEGACGT